ncbi:MAG: SdpI family protein [Chloroflexota bacterium]
MINQTMDFRNNLLMSGLIVLIMFAIGGYVWIQIPAGAEVCTHWNAAGICDDYGSKFVSILLMPIIVAGVAALLAWVPRFDPRAAHLAQSGKAYTAVWVGILLFFLAVYVTLMLNVLGYADNVGAMIPLLIGLLFMVIGNYLGKVRSNFIMGIRTPWTLSSELSWNKTHRLGGRLFVLLGLVFVISGFVFPGGAWIYVLVSSVLLVVGFLMAYSYVVWKGEQVTG